MTEPDTSIPTPARHAVPAVAATQPAADTYTHVPVLQVISADVQADADDPSDAVLYVEIDDPEYGVMAGEMRLTPVKARRMIMQLQVQQQEVQAAQHVLDGGSLDDFTPSPLTSEWAAADTAHDDPPAGGDSDDDDSTILPTIVVEAQREAKRRADPARLMPLFIGLMQESPAAQILYLLIGALLVLSFIVVILNMIF